MGKLVIGTIIGSVSVLSEAIHSGIDLLAAIIALYAVRNAGKPADKDHQFGHGKIENLSGAIEALLIFAAGVWIIYEAVNKILNPEPIDRLGLGLVIMLVSAVANTAVSTYLFKVGKATESQALLADAWHLRTDVYTSIGVVSGLTMMWIGRTLWPQTDWHWIDPVTAIFVALLIFKAAVTLTRQAAADLMDTALPVSELEWIKDLVRGSKHHILSFHSLRTRKSGAERFIEFHLSVDAHMSVEESHAIAQEFEDIIMQRFAGASVTIHVEPCNDAHCDSACQSGCYTDKHTRA